MTQRNDAMKIGYLLPSAFLTLIGLAMYLLPEHSLQFAGWGEIFSWGVISFVMIGIALLTGAQLSKRKIISKANPAGGFTRQLAVGSLVVAGFEVLSQAILYLIIRFSSTPSPFGDETFQSLTNSAALPSRVVFSTYHTDYHFAVASSLAVGFAVALIYLGAGPVRRGEAWGWKAALLTGFVPSTGILTTDAAVFIGAEPINHIHASTIALVLFWLAGTALAIFSTDSNRQSHGESDS